MERDSFHEDFDILDILKEIWKIRKPLKGQCVIISNSD